MATVVTDIIAIVMRTAPYNLFKAFVLPFRAPPDQQPHFKPDPNCHHLDRAVLILDSRLQ